MKKVMAFWFITMMVAVAGALVAYGAEKDGITIDTTNASKGYVTVTDRNPLNKPVKVMISFGETKYNYDLKSNNATNFPLQLGVGEYKVWVLEQVAGTSYKTLLTDTVKVDTISEKDLYTNSIQIIDYLGSSSSMTELSKLVKDAKTDTEKIDIIYNYIVKNFSYDFAKISKITSDYIPNNDSTYNAKSGICYDFSSIFASALRSNGIPAKLQKGYFTEVEAYHAWNMVFLDGKWCFIDTTYDAQANGYKMAYAKVKDPAKFKVMYFY